MSTERLSLVDALRGFALLGLCLCHASELFELYWQHYQPSRIHDAVFFMFEGKSFALFALMFGVSFFIIMDRAARRGVDFSWRFVWRLLLLAAIGYLHGLVYKGDVLKILAVLGLVLVPAQRLSNRWLLGLAMFCLLQPQLWFKLAAALQGAAWTQHDWQQWTATPPPYADGSLWTVLQHNSYAGQVSTWWWYLDVGRIPQIVALFLLGLVLGRSGFFSAPARFERMRRRILLTAIALCVMLYCARPTLVTWVPFSAQLFMPRRCVERLIDSYFNLSLMVVWAITFIEMYLRFDGALLNRFAAAGRMTLTLYVMQSLIMVPIFYGFGLGWFDKVTQAQAVSLGVAVFATQLMYARWWFKHFYYGPLEWVWRSLTYLSTAVPWQRENVAA